MGSYWCRVLVVEPGEGLWGGQRYVLNLADLLAERGVDQVLAAPEHTDLAAAWRAAGRTVVPFSPPHERSIRRGDGGLSVPLAARELWRTVAHARQLARLAGQVEADVLQASTHWNHLEVVAAARMARRPAVLHLLDQSRADALGRLRALAVLGAASTVSCSETVRATLPRRAAAKVTTVPIGIDVHRFRPGLADPQARSQLSAHPDAPIVLVLARIVAEKGITDVIRAVHSLPARLGPVSLAIAGASEDPDFATEVHRLGTDLLGDRLRLLGARSDVPELLRAADVFVLASEAEGMPISILEAQASGVPVVAYPAGGGAAELITHRETGLLARQGNTADLASQLALVLSDRQLATDLANRARTRVLKEQSLQRQADRHVAILAQVRRRPGRPEPADHANA